MTPLESSKFFKEKEKKPVLLGILYCWMSAGIKSFAEFRFRSYLESLDLSPNLSKFSLRSYSKLPSSQKVLFQKTKFRIKSFKNVKFRHKSYVKLPSSKLSPIKITKFIIKPYIASF